MKLLPSNNKGVALVTSLMLTLITLGIIMALFYVMIRSIRISASVKRYRNVTEATYGGGELMAFGVIGDAFKNMSSAGGMANSLASTYGNINLSLLASNDCFKQKLTAPASHWTACSALQKSMELTTIKSAPDLTFLLKGTSNSQNYKVYAKVVDTSTGNTDTSSSALLNADDKEGLLSGSGTAYNKTGTGGVPIQHVPYGYRIEVQGEKEANAVETSNVTILYEY